MTWENYRKQRVKRFTFEKFGCPEFWVDLRSLSALSWGEAKKFQNLDVADAEALAQSEEILIWAIQDWYILDPTTEDTPLPLPRQDRSVLDPPLGKLNGN